MDIKFICEECKKEVKEKSNFCPHCGKPLVMVETTFTAIVEVKFTEKPGRCSDCRFGKQACYKSDDFTGKSEFKGECLLNPDIKFGEQNKNQYFGFYGAKIEKCPLIINQNIKKEE